MTLIHAFAPIVKTSLTDDGFLSVYGMATGPQLDLDQQICDPEWLKSAMPQWFDTGANIREMHQPSAVGVGTDLETVGDDHWVTCKVVDQAAITKVDQKVYTGFSIGIKSPKIVKDAAAPNGRIVGGTIVEISLVDRPCNGSAKLVLAKAAGDGDTLTAVDVTKDGGPLDETTIVGNVETGDDETVETDLIGAVITAIKQLLVGEATELADGEGGSFPVQMLLNILADLETFVTCDSYDDAMCTMAAKYAASPQEDLMNLTTLSTLVKAATADDASVADTEAAAELRKALGLDDLHEQIDTLQTKAAASENLVQVEARLAKVETTVIDYGPRRTAPAVDPVTVAVAERLNKAAEYRRLSETVEDRSMALAYKQLADSLTFQS